MLMKTMNSLRVKRSSKKGFTLMEMLIVVAIIAVLVAIAIPVFSAQLNKAKEQVDAANLRSATSMAVVDYLSNAKTGDVTYYANDDGNHTMVISTTKATAYAPQYSGNSGCITVVVSDGGEVTSAAWK